MKTPPRELNSYPVIAMLPDRSGCVDAFFVVVKRLDAHETYDYVVAYWRPRCEDTWLSGYYTDSLDDALANLLERAGLAGDQ